MKDETTSLLNEVRVKLHIKSNIDTQVRNFWMCLNYDQKPCVSHIVEHIKKNLCPTSTNTAAAADIKLYLDDFWLPNYESSRLIRENDCVKVELNYDEKLSTTTRQAEWSQTTCKSRNQTKKHDQQWSDDRQATGEHELTNNNPYNHYFENENNENEAAKTRQHYFNPFEFWTSNHNLENPTKSSANHHKSVNTATVTAAAPTIATAAAKPKEVKITKQLPSPKKLQTSVKSSSIKQQQQNKVNTNHTQQCYKKFAVGSYAHLLNEPVEEQQHTVSNNKKATSHVKNHHEEEEVNEDEVRSDYYFQKQSKYETDEVDFNRIASNVNSTGRQKWKNSTKSTQSNGPKHIIFPSSSESESSSSSSESESEAPVQRKTTTTTTTTVSNQKKTNFYEPTKEEQLNAVNTNRSFTVQNPKKFNRVQKCVQ